MPSELHAERREGTLVLTISDPATRNSLSKQVFLAGVEALNVAESDDSIRCIVLRGDGDHFCSGGDLHQLKATHGAGDPQAQDRLLQHFHEFIEVLRVFPKPVIASVEGPAAGGGFSLALACDLIVAAESATFVVPQGGIGLSPEGGVTWQLMQRLPRQLALQMIWLAEPCSAQTLHAHGVVNWLAGTGQALNVALDVAARLAGCAPNAVASVKELVNQWPQNTLVQQMDLERAHFLGSLFHANGGEGLHSSAEKRAPRFE